MNRLLLSRKSELKKNISKPPQKIYSKEPINDDFILSDNFCYNINDSYITYINLEDRTDRRKIFENFYSKQSYQPIRFNAIQTNSHEFKNKYPHLKLTNTMNDIKNIKWINGTLGCYDSHYTILNDHVEDKDNKFLVILEDDCIISSYNLNKCLQFLKENDTIDILRINCWKEIPCNPYQFKYTNTHSKYKNDYSEYFDGGTHCCIFLTKNIKNVINFMNNEYVFQIDALYSTNKINSVVFNIKDEIKYKSMSSIQKKGLNLNDLEDKKIYQKLLIRK